MMPPNISVLMNKLEKIRVILGISATQSSDDWDDVIDTFRKFELTHFDVGVLLLGAGCMLDSEISGEVSRRTESPYPTLRLALELFEDANWESIILKGQLRKNDLISLQSPKFFLDSPYVVSERALSMMMGIEWESNDNDNKSIPSLDRIYPKATWDQIVLPEEQLRLLQEIAIHARNRSLVLNNWGFSDKYSRGLGISALFYGVSGTGKTMACEVLANELGYDLYRVDLSQVINKYIGETEKNLAKVFDCMEKKLSILLFDEADALFGKRSEVKDSHDRYANIEVGYLLSRMENYQGLTVLTTNMKSNLDQAFLRRLCFSVHFPFPNRRSRELIWKSVYPTKTPLGEIDFEGLARFQLSGGNIKNTAKYAAYLSADEGSPVQMKHVKRALAVECEKCDMTVSNTQLESLLDSSSDERITERSSIA